MPVSTPDGRGAMQAPTDHRVERAWMPLACAGETDVSLVAGSALVDAYISVRARRWWAGNVQRGRGRPACLHAARVARLRPAGSRLLEPLRVAMSELHDAR